MKCLSVDIGQCYCIWQFFVFWPSSIYSFFFSVIIILFQGCVFVLPFLHYLAHLRYILQVPSGFLSILCLYSLFSVVPDFGCSLSDRHTQWCFSQKIWCTCGPLEILYFSESLPYSWHCNSIIFCFSSFLLTLPICFFMLHTSPHQITPLIHIWLGKS